jgi:DNA polymerase-3 subunit beta
MDLYIQRDELIRGMARVQGIVERRTTNLSLSHVLLRAHGNQLRMTATDTMLTLVADYEANVQTDGELSVDAQALFQIARALPDNTVHLQAEAGNRLAIRSGSAEFHIVGMSAEEFPPSPARDETDGMEVVGKDLQRIIEETLFGVTADDNRYGLNGAHLEEVTSENGEARVRLVTTDGSRLCYSEAPYQGKFGMGRKMLVPRKALAEVKKLSESIEGNWSISFGERSATFSTDGLTLMVRLVDGEFPDYRQVLPTSFKRKAVTQGSTFSDALRRLAIVASDRNHSVRFAFEADRLVLTAQNVDLGDAREEVGVELEGEPLFTGFNVRYFQDIMGATKADRLLLQMGDALDPCIVQVPDRDDSLFVVMPMRLD